MPPEQERVRPGPVQKSYEEVIFQGDSHTEIITAANWLTVLTAELQRVNPSTEFDILTLSGLVKIFPDYGRRWKTPSSVTVDNYAFGRYQQTRRTARSADDEIVEVQIQSSPPLEVNRNMPLPYNITGLVVMTNTRVNQAGHPFKDPKWLPSFWQLPEKQRVKQIYKNREDLFSARINRDATDTNRFSGLLTIFNAIRQQ